MTRFRTLRLAHNRRSLNDRHKVLSSPYFPLQGGPDLVLRQDRGRRWRVYIPSVGDVGGGHVENLFSLTGCERRC